MLVQICCSVDSHYFLMKLREIYPDEKLIGYFYNPNIHPINEYLLRFNDVKKSCDNLDIELLDGEYEIKEWMNDVKGFEDEPERANRCLICFENRLRATAKKANELGEKKITTTLLMSPKKSIEQLKTAGENISKKFNQEFIVHDFRKGGGTQAQFSEAKKQGFYHQNYCGCMFGLKKQKEHKETPLHELYSHVNAQVQLGSVESRLELYKNDKKKISQRFLNYRLLRGFVKNENKIIRSYILSYSKTNKPTNKGQFEALNDELYLFSKEPIYGFSLAGFNLHVGKTYTSIKELLSHPLTIKEELELRQKICGFGFDLTPIIIFEEVPTCRVEIYIEAVTFEDVREL